MQCSLNLDAASVGASHWQRKLEWLRRAVAVLGHKEVAYKLDVAPSNLTDALLERERKDVKAKWLDVVLAMDLPEEMRAEWVRLNCDACGYETPQRKRKMTAEDELVAMREAMAKIAPGLLTLIDKEMGR